MNRRSLALIVALSAALAACPHLPEPSGCPPRSYRCAVNPADEPLGDHPEVCSPAQRWTRIGDVGCQAIAPGTTCVLENGLAFCARPRRAPSAPQSRRDTPASFPQAHAPTLAPTQAPRAARRVAGGACAAASYSLTTVCNLFDD